MGTSVTPNISLIKPDINESIRQNLPTYPGWPTQNVNNMTIIDNLFRASTSSYALTLAAATSGPTLGAGSLLEGKYVRLWPRMVIGFFRIYLGAAGFAAGTGDYRINLPSTMDPTLAASDGSRTLPVGKALYRDANSLPNSSVMLVEYDPASNRMVFQRAQGSIFSSADAEQDDRITGYFMYPTADA